MTYKGIRIADPLGTWAQMNDGTYNLADVMQWHIAVEEIKESFPTDG